MDDDPSNWEQLYVFIPDIITLLFLVWFTVISRCFLKPNTNRESTSSFIQAEAFASVDRGLGDD